MFKKGNNIFSLLVVILSIFMTSTPNIVNADSTGVSTPQTATTASTTAETDQSSTTDWGNQLITKVQLQDSTGQPMTEFHQNDNMRAYWEFSTANKVFIVVTQWKF